MNQASLDNLAAANLAKKLSPDTKRTTLNLTPEARRLLRVLGEGNMTLGAERLVLAGDVLANFYAVSSQENRQVLKKHGMSVARFAAVSKQLTDSAK